MDPERGGAVVTELALLASDPSALEAAGDPVQSIVLACERAKTWLAYALDHDLGVDQIVEMKSQAEAIRVYTVQKQLGKDSELSAQEIVRRAERCIGLAIRKGQESGEIRKPHASGGPRRDYVRDGKTVRAGDRGADDNLKSPKDFIPHAHEAVETYAMTDGVTNEQFDSAIGQAKAERNLSRANVVRKVRDQQSEVPVTARLEEIRELADQGYSSQQIAARLGATDEYIRRLSRTNGIEIRADKLLGRTRKTIDQHRIVSETVTSLEGMVMALDFLDVTQIDDLSEIDYWVTSLSSSLRSLNQRLLKPLKEMQ